MQNTKIEENKFREILYANLDMLFAKLEAENEELDKLNSELEGGTARKKD